MTHPPTQTRRWRPALVLAAIFSCLLLALPDPADAALQKIAGYKGGGDNGFASLTNYFNGLRDAIIPLAVPIAAIGLIIGGIIYMAGGHRAGQTLIGVVVGIGLILMAPSLVA